MRLLTIQHVPCEGPGLLEDKLIKNGWELDIKHMYLPDTLPQHLDHYDALMILGGPMGAYEEDVYPCLCRIQELVREAAAREIPVVGICLGGQIIARALGANVGPNPQKEIGWSPIMITNEGKQSPLFHNLPKTFPVFQWHGDTFALPEGATLLASSEICKNQAFVYRDHIWALQFHLEVTPEMVRTWSEVYRNELTQFGGPGAYERLQRNTGARWDSMHPWREQFLNNLLSILQGRFSTNRLKNIG